MFVLGHGVGHLFWIASEIWITEIHAETVSMTVLLFLGSTALEMISSTDPAASNTTVLKAILLTFA